MDTLTHIAVGACIGEMIAGRHLGKMAMVYGAAMQSLPDIDVIATFWLDPVSDLLAHRSFTHSFLFAAIVAPFLAYLAWRTHMKQGLLLGRWIWFFTIEMVIHLFLDAFNAYGTGWFEPFSHARISFNSIFVADPLFSIWPGVAFVVLVVMKKNHSHRKWWVAASLSIISVYLSLSLINKLVVFHDVKNMASEKGIRYNRYFTTPTPMNTLLWFVVLETDSGYQVGYRSVFDRKPEMDFHYFPRNGDLLKPLAETKPVKQLLRFSQGFYTVEKYSDTLVFNDLRFGQMIGWRDPAAGFAFHYYLNLPEENRLVVQRGRFSGWDRNAFWSLLRKIKGN